MTNAVVNRSSFSNLINSEGYQKAISNALMKDDRRIARFVANITSAVAANPALNDCAPKSVLAGALLGEALGLSPSPQLGHFFLVPYADKKEKARTGYEKVAQFQMGYKGYTTLAMSSGQYKKIILLPVKKGELVGFNPFEEEYTFSPCLDPVARMNLPTVGYYIKVITLAGTEKAIYMSREEMIAHADRYSPAFSATAYDKTINGSTKHIVSFEDYLAKKYDPRDEWLYSSFWYKDFDTMALKTMVRKMFTKWGILSPSLGLAIESDFKTGDIESGEPVFTMPDAEADAEIPGGENEEPTTEPETIAAPGAAPYMPFPEVGETIKEPEIGFPDFMKDAIAKPGKRVKMSDV